MTDDGVGNEKLNRNRAVKPRFHRKGLPTVVASALRRHFLTYYRRTCWEIYTTKEERPFPTT